MGSWNGTCMISNLHIHARQNVVVFLLAQNHQEKTFCYSNALYDVCPLPFYGKYNDYGAVEDCHGVALPYILNDLKHQLYEFGQGPNSSHDCEVNKQNFNLEKLFEADHEDRLGIHNFNSYNSDEYDIRELERMREESGLTSSQQFELDRLFSKLKKEDNFRRVTHITIHGEVFKTIMDEYFIDDYVGEGAGTQGWKNSYNHIYFKDIEASIPAYVAELKKQREKSAAEGENSITRSIRRMMRGREWDNPNLAAKWLSSFNSSHEFSIVDVPETISVMVDEEQWDELAAFAKEALIGLWINSFLSISRKMWTQTTGKGSQSAEYLPYEILNSAISNVIAKEKKEYGYDEDEEDE